MRGLQVLPVRRRDHGRLVTQRLRPECQMRPLLFPARAQAIHLCQGPGDNPQIRPGQLLVQP